MKIYTSSDQKFLTLKLFDERSDKFVRASLFDSAMTFIGFFTLSHVANGFYKNLISLSLGKYYVFYEVFKDSGYTVKDKNYSDAEEFISVENTEELIDLINDNIDDNEGRIA
jgi:hypothetical protein